MIFNVLMPIGIISMWLFRSLTPYPATNFEKQAFRLHETTILGGFSKSEPNWIWQAFIPSTTKDFKYLTPGGFT